jgi:positive regulator of sigma E activity
MELEGFTPFEDVAFLAIVFLLIGWAIARTYVRKRATSEKPSAEFWNWK